MGSADDGGASRMREEREARARARGTRRTAQLTRTRCHELLLQACPPRRARQRVRQRPEHSSLYTRRPAAMMGPSRRRARGSPRRGVDDLEGRLSLLFCSLPSQGSRGRIRVETTVVRALLGIWRGAVMRKGKAAAVLQAAAATAHVSSSARDAPPTTLHAKGL